jgi:hypothetical protein
LGPIPTFPWECNLRIALACLPPFYIAMFLLF